jgi:hypothetical protein
MRFGAGRSRLSAGTRTPHVHRSRLSPRAHDAGLGNRETARHLGGQHRRFRWRATTASSASSTRRSTGLRGGIWRAPTAADAAPRVVGAPAEFAPRSARRTAASHRARGADSHRLGVPTHGQHGSGAPRPDRLRPRFTVLAACGSIPRGGTGRPSVSCVAGARRRRLPVAAKLMKPPTGGRTMTVKELEFGDSSLRRILRGVDVLADAVGVTLGPKGRYVVLQRPFGAPLSTKDGATVAKGAPAPDRRQRPRPPAGGGERRARRRRRLRLRCRDGRIR